MATCRVGAVIDALVAQFDAGTTVQVFDGPATGTTAPDDFVMVGADEEGESAIPVEQAWVGLGAKARDETGRIPCAVVALGPTVKACRDRCLAILADLETALVADPTLGGVVSGGVMLVEDGTLRQASTGNGVRASLTFTVHYKARL